MKAGVVVLAGGEATRLPEKVERDAGGVPLVVRVVHNVCSGRETFVSCKGSFAPLVDALLDAPCVVDHWPRRGPLAGLVSTAARMRSRFVFAIAADAPFVDAAFLAALEGAHALGDEAVVPAHVDAHGNRRLQPLAALYDRFALLREGVRELRGAGSVSAVAGCLRTRVVDVPGAKLLNVNTPHEYDALLERLARARPPA